MKDKLLKVLPILLLIIIPQMKAISGSFPCAASCSCSEEVIGNDIAVQILCDGRDPSVTVTVIDGLLRDRNNITKLDINSCVFTTIPPSICHMTRLKSLNLDRNHLTEISADCLLGMPALSVFSAVFNRISILSAGEPSPTRKLSQLAKVQLDYNSLERFPDKWFAHMPNLTELSVTDNKIIELQDGVFDGLENLLVIALDNNVIKTIGPRVFSAASGLRSLSRIKMDYNYVQTLDTWIFERGRLGKNGNVVSIFLQDNLVTKFSNALNWKFSCDDLQFHLQVILAGNKVKHLSDAIKAWGLDWSVCNSSVAQIQIIGQQLSCDCWDYDYFKRFSPNGEHRWLFVTDSDCRADKMSCNLTDQCPPECNGCIYRPVYATMFITCSSSNLTDVPRALPSLSNLEKYTKYSIDVSQNSRIKRLENRKYYANTSQFDVSSTGLESIDADAIVSLLTFVRIVRMNNNRLKVLPSDITSMEIVTETIDITDNPWLCSCDNRWMIDWLIKVRTRLTNPDNILCYFPSSMYRKSIIGLTHDDVCVDRFARSTYIAISISISSFFVIAITVTVSVVTARHFRYALFARYGIHPFDQDECENEAMDYDVFLFCNEDDERPSGDEIVDQIELRGYRVCYGRRDFELGDLVTANVNRAVERSKRTVFLVSTNFIDW